MLLTQTTLGPFLGNLGSVTQDTFLLEALSKALFQALKVFVTRWKSEVPPTTEDWRRNMGTILQHDRVEPFYNTIAWVSRQI